MARHWAGRRGTAGLRSPGLPARRGPACGLSLAGLMGLARAGRWARSGEADGRGGSRLLGSYCRARRTRRAGAGGPLAICSS
jgi:hypothetical protein